MLVEHQDYLIKPDGFNIPYDAERVHGISTELATAEGIPLAEVLEKFSDVLSEQNLLSGKMWDLTLASWAANITAQGSKPACIETYFRYLYRNYGIVAENSGRPRREVQASHSN